MLNKSYISLLKGLKDQLSTTDCFTNRNVTLGELTVDIPALPIPLQVFLIILLYLIIFLIAHNSSASQWEE